MIKIPLQPFLNQYHQLDTFKLLAFYLYYLINFTLIIGYQFCIKTYLHPTAHLSISLAGG